MAGEGLTPWVDPERLAAASQACPAPVESDGEEGWWQREYLAASTKLKPRCRKVCCRELPAVVPSDCSKTRNSNVSHTPHTSPHATSFARPLHLCAKPGFRCPSEVGSWGAEVIRKETPACGLPALPRALRAHDTLAAGAVWVRNSSMTSSDLRKAYLETHYAKFEEGTSLAALLWSGSGRHAG